MSLFLAGSDLTAAIKNVLDGDDVRCAVAFWGRGAEKLFNPPTKGKPRIICDVTLGGTSPNALSVLGAPHNDKLRHIPSLHAKVYVSKRGAVVGSANASENGIGFDGPPGHLEAGTLMEPGDDAFRKIEDWFEELYKKSNQVDEAAIKLATKRFRPERTSGRTSARPGSLLDLISSDPDRFSDVSIVIVNRLTPADVGEEILETARQENPKATPIFEGVNNGDIFSGWGRDDLDRWRRTFIELWMPGKRLSAFGRKVVYFHEPQGAVIGLRDWQAVRKTIGGDLPTQEQISQADGEIVRWLLDTHGNRLYSASELGLEIEKFHTGVRS